MNPNLFRSVEFYQRRYHNYATVLIIPLSLLFTFILIFSLVATKEITVTSQGEIAPTSVIASIQSTSDNPILANHLVANQVVEKGDLLIKYSETMEESQKTALATQLQRLEKQKEGLGILKQSLETTTDLFSGEDEFGYHNTFMNFTKQSHDIELGITKTNTEVSNQANLSNSSSSAIEQEITKVQQQIGEYQELRDAIINNRARLPTGNPHQSILNRYLVASQGQTQGTAEEPFLSQINQSIAGLESSIASLKIQQAGIGSVATYDNSLATKIEVLRTQFLQTASQQQLTVENQLTELKVQLDQATQRLENNTLTSPSKGIVHLNSEFEGKNRIPTGTEIAQIFPVITDTREVLITYYVSSDYLPLLDKGQTVRLKLEKIGNHGTTIIGQLQTIDQTPTRTEQGNLFKPQLFTPNLKTIQNPCLSLDPGWFLFSPNGCFLLDKKEFPLYGISVEKNTKRKETHMNSLPNHHFQNKSFYQLSFDGGHLTQYGGLIFFQELFSQLKLKERISKYLVTNDQRRYCRYSDSDILVQFLFQLLTGYGTDYACKELSADAYFPKLLEGGQLASQPTLSRFLSRTDEETVHSLRCLNLELVEFFLQFHQLNQLIVDIDSTHFTTYGKQEGVAYNAHYRAHGYHPLYAFEGKTGYCFNAQLRPGNRYCSEEADSFITPVLERFNQLLFRMDSGFATPKLYDLIEKTGQYYLIKLKKNTVLSRLGDLSLPCPQDEDLTILPHSVYSETLYQAGSWSHKRRVCQFSERKEGNLFYDVISLVTNMTSGTSQDQFQLYRGRGQAENFIKEMKEGFFGDKTDSSTLIKNEVRMMMSCIAYNLYLFLKHLAGGDFQTLTIKRFRHLFLHVVGKCVRTGRKQLLKLSSLYAYSELFSALYSRIRKVNLNLPVPYEPPRRKASLMMH